MARQISRPMLDRLFDAAQGSGRSQRSGRDGGMNVTRRLLLAASCLCAACFMPAPSFAAAPMVKKQAPVSRDNLDENGGGNQSLKGRPVASL